MGKDGGFLTPKAISNRIKAKGLQKLKFYCQACEKQCRDANGFKCHCQSEGHRRQMQLVQQQQSKFVSDFSKQFEKAFMDLVRTRYRSKKVKANKVYNDYISDRNHIHMNSTNWLSLTEFVMYLGRTGKVIAEDTPKGWYIRYVDQEEMQRVEDRLKQEKVLLDDEKRAARDLELQRSRVLQELSSTEISSEKTGLQRENKEEKIVFSISKEKKPTTPAKPVNLLKDDEPDDELTSSGPVSGKKRMLDELREENEQKKQKLNDASTKFVDKVKTASGSKKKKNTSWLYKSLIVKIKSKELADGKYYNQKGVILKVVDKYGAEIQVLSDKRKILLDQTYLETVIPAIEGFVMVVMGPHKGKVGTLASLNVEQFTGTVLLSECGTEVVLDYSAFCKVHVV